MTDLLLPETDLGVLAQIIGVLAISMLALRVTRRHRELRVLTVGSTILVLGLIGLRALH